MSIKNIENTSDSVSWLNFKGYDIRLEKSKEFTQGNLMITVTPKGYEDYTDKFIVKTKGIKKKGWDEKRRRIRLIQRI